MVTSRFRLDGGSMFGVVPRVLWEEKATPDGRNRIPLNVNSLVIESGERLILVEAGMGSKFSPGLRDIYDLGGGDALTALRRLGLSPGDIDTVVLTHLHLDHAGGATVSGDGGPAVPAFPGARYIIQEEEWSAAVDPHPLARGSYSPDDFMPLHRSGQLELVRGEKEVAPGVTVELTGGHTRGHQVVRLRSGGQEAIYPGDLIPTVAHLKVNWLMSWDLYPEDVWRQKECLLEEAARRRSLLLFTHDPVLAASRVEQVKPGVYSTDPRTALEAGA